jgi:O-antigen ligase
VTAVGGRRPALLAVGLAALLVAVAFVGKGGTELGRLVTVEIGLLVVAGLALAAAVLFGAAPRLYGIGAVLGFVLLAVVTGLSITWSLAADESWIEANRTLTYLFVFTAAVAAGNLFPGSLRAVLSGITLAAIAVVAYGLASRIWPESLGELEFYARLGQPFGYWNAVGVIAAMGLVGTVWFGTRRELGPRLGALAAPAGVLLITALLLTYSRSGLVAALVVLGLWLFVVPLRLRTLAVLGAAALGTVPVAAWALSQAAFTEDGVDVSVRADAGPTFGLLLLLGIALAYVVCLAVFVWRERNALAPDARRRAGRVAAIAAGCLVLAGFGALATTERGIGGTLSDRLEELTDDSAQSTGGPGRLGTTASARSRYWRAAAEVFEDHPAVGAGAGAFAVTNLRYRETANVSRHAHGYFVQTLADLGVVGLIVSLIALCAWLFAALRAIGATPRSTIGQRFLLGDRRVNFDRAPAWTDERIAVTALFFAALAYGLQAAADWTWFVPAPTTMALVAAGYVAGRRPPRAPADPPDSVSVAKFAPWRAVVAAAIVLTTIACIWNAWQPQRADDLANDAFALMTDGDFEGAFRTADEAREVNGLSPKPLWASAAALASTGQFEDAHDVLEDAVKEHPNLAEAWQRLADFRLDRLNDPHGALDAIEPALYLDPQSFAVHQSFVDIRDRFRALGELPPDTAPYPPGG